MTISQLIEELRQFPQGQEVCTHPAGLARWMPCQTVQEVFIGKDGYVTTESLADKKVVTIV